jgi:hypothetical protein
MAARSISQIQRSGVFDNRDDSNLAVSAADLNRPMAPAGNQARSR